MSSSSRQHGINVVCRRSPRRSVSASNVSTNNQTSFRNDWSDINSSSTPTRRRATSDHGKSQGTIHTKLDALLQELAGDESFLIASKSAEKDSAPIIVREESKPAESDIAYNHRTSTATVTTKSVPQDRSKGRVAELIASESSARMQRGLCSFHPSVLPAR
eukprot:scaffold656939_cov38-Prasinocladus_malaysianus.AAC.1